MADTIFKLIPTKSEYVAEMGNLEKAKDLFASFVPQADEITLNVYDKTKFFDPGTNLEKVSCPKCNKDITDWWSGEGMGIAKGDSFDSLEIVTPCCQSRVSLNDLIYDWPAGFARFSLEARNPKIKDLTGSQIKELQDTLNIPLKKIWSHI